MASHAHHSQLHHHQAQAQVHLHHYDEVTDLFPSLSATSTTATTMVAPRISSYPMAHSVAGDSEHTKVYSRSRTAFIAKLQRLQTDGIHQLKVVTDFDFTLTKFHIFREATETPVRYRGSSCHGVLETSQLLNPRFHELSAETFERYHAYEVDPYLAYEVKYQHMMEWAHSSNRLLLEESGLHQRHIIQAVQSALSAQRVQLRQESRQFFQLTQGRAIPVLIFSAGISDVLEQVLHQSFVSDDAGSHDAAVSLLAHCHIVSNRCVFDPAADGKLIAMSEPVIHVMNKRSATFRSVCPFFHSDNEIQRQNVMLIGDNPGDILMADGMAHDPHNCMKIGFLNDKIDERFDAYLDIYDVVVIGDRAGFDVPVYIIDSIVAASK